MYQKIVNTKIGEINGGKKKKETNLKKTFDSIGNILFVRRIRVRVMVTKDSGRKKKKKKTITGALPSF